MLESQLIRTEKLNFQHSFITEIFYENELKTQFNSDFVIGNIQYNQQFFKNGMRLQAFYELGKRTRSAARISIFKSYRRTKEFTNGRIITATEFSN